MSADATHAALELFVREHGLPLAAGLADAGQGPLDLPDVLIVDDPQHTDREPSPHMREAVVDWWSTARDEECGCCELGEYDGDPDSAEPWCKQCNHSPEEHEPDEVQP